MVAGESLSGPLLPRMVESGAAATLGVFSSAAVQHHSMAAGSTGNTADQLNHDELIRSQLANSGEQNRMLVGGRAVSGGTPRYGEGCIIPSASTGREPL